ncbi:MAG TPA: biotin/lipoyl-binding protein, partial [Candidatus Deferrimicrobium sp.]|nr:biotin/lipoyl-binding protein [Candidatus Deferrimicrobium sp.]
MNRRFTLGAAALIVFLAAAGCSSKEGVEKGKADPAAKPAVSVDASIAATGDVTEGIEVIGTLSPKYQAEMKSEYGGVVAQVYVNDWAKVRKGDPLLKVDTREGQAILQKAKAALEMAKAGQLEAEAAVARV